MRRSRVSFVAGVALLVIAAAVAGIGGYFGVQAARTRHAPPMTSIRPPAAYLAAGAAPSGPATAHPTSAVTAAALSRQLRSVVGASAFGGQFRLRVIALTSGTVLFDRAGTAPGAPASTAKLLTAAALLAVRKPTDRLRTTVRAGARGTLVLVGAGDPTLSGAAPGKAPVYAGAARITALAEQVKRRHFQARRIVVDDSLFTGPSVSPAWAAEDIPSDYAAPITAVLADGGRGRPDDSVRSTTPDLGAGRELAGALGRPNLSVTRTSRPAVTGRVLGTVLSAPLGTLIEQMLQLSDNVIAECLARQVALAVGQSASFTGAAAAIRTVLSRYHAAVGTGMRDGSGLARADRLSAAALLAVLGTAARAPRLRALLDAMPVAGWSGTLTGRYRSASTRIGAGLARAKTGSLTGVATLAGIVRTSGGALLGFAALADRTPDTRAAEAALDAMVIALVRCGCA